MTFLQVYVYQADGRIPRRATAIYVPSDSLTLLAPDIIEAIVDGREPDGLSLELLRRPMSMVWAEQDVKLRTLNQSGRQG